MRDFFQFRKELREEIFGTFFIKFEGIKKPEKVDIAYERATQYTFGALMGDDDIEMDGEPDFLTPTSNILQVRADKSEQKKIQSFLNRRNKLAKQTQEMIKKGPIAPKDRGNPKATTGADRVSDSNIRKLYQKRADHFYVTALLMKLANPNTAPIYSIQKFMKESINEDIAYHKKAIDHHKTYAHSHDTERLNHDSDDEHDNDHANAEDSHNDAANHHQRAHDAAKKHGTNSSQYKTAAKAAHTASKDAHDNHVDFETISRKHPSKNLTIKKTH